MNAHGRFRAGLLLLFLVVAWATMCAGRGAAQEKPQFAWYGFVKFDASWDQGLVSSGNFARWVASEDAFPHHSRFSLTSRQTRLGFTTSAQVGGAALTGRWEVDFYGGGAEHRNALQIRHAYVDIVWPSGWSILAGQGWDVISPLSPGTLNYTVAWWAGNTGYRRPQLRVTKRIRTDEGAEVRFEGAATRTVGDDVTAVEPGDSGTDSGIPTFQGLFGVRLPAAGRTLEAGAFMHRGEENLVKILAGEPTVLPSSGWGVYLALPLATTLMLSGEAWSGTNLDDYHGGIGQGVRIQGREANAVRARGGWAELALRTARGTNLQVGYSVDDANADDLAPRARDRNTAFWGTASHSPGGGLRYGLELSRWHTRYMGIGPGKSWRVQGSVIYTF